MAISLLTNLPAIIAADNLNQTSDNYQRSVEHLATGSKLTRPGDDPSGLARSGLAEAEVRSTDALLRNTNEAKGAIQLTEGNLNEIQNLLLRVKELAVAAASDWIDSDERDAIIAEYSQLRDEVDRIADTTRYKGMALLSGQSQTIGVQVGTGNTEADRLDIEVGGMDAHSSALGIDNLNLDSWDAAVESLDSVDQAIAAISRYRARAGGVQTRLTSASNQILNQRSVAISQLSMLRDTDVAKEATNLLRYEMAQKAQVAVLSQANMLNQIVASLLKP